MLASKIFTDGLNTERRVRSRLDEVGLRKLAVLEAALRLVSRLTRRDRALLQGLLRMRNVTAASRGSARTYASRRTHQVLLPAGEALVELVRLYLDGDFGTVLLRLECDPKPPGVTP